MAEFMKGAGLSFGVNLLTVVGWVYVGIWPPSVGNVLLALLLTGIYGLEDRWAFPIGYWIVELLAIIAWMMGVGGMLQMAG